MSHDETQEIEQQVVELLVRCVASSTSSERHAAEVKLLVHVGLARDATHGRLAARVLMVLSKRGEVAEAEMIPTEARPLSLPDLARWALPRARYPEWFWTALIESLRDPRLAVAAAMVLGEALRQTGGFPPLPAPPVP